MESMNTLRYNYRREKLRHRYIRCRLQKAFFHVYFNQNKQIIR